MSENEAKDNPIQEANGEMPRLAAGGSLNQLDSKQWALFLHLSQLTSLLIPGLGIVGPILIWQLKKDQFPDLERHGKMVCNWLISLLIYCASAFFATLVTCGFGMILYIPVALIAIIFPIIGGIRASKGQFWIYPLTISFIK